ncbi:MAG TPA: FtsX-like permease family protein [Candidatus Elarobacter sp.]|jgi:putative ABC transport system permease protein|nr:FtsX-like permease family protein [Candidatus Elarobacter sp.]
MSLFRALVLGPLRANALRALVTVVAVALGVAIGLAIDLSSATAVGSFATSVNVVSNKVNLQVLGIARGFDERTILRVQRIPGVTYASPTIEDQITVGARPGDMLSGEILRVLGVDLLRPLPGGHASSSAAPGGFDDGGVDPWMLVNGHGAFVSAQVAQRMRLRTGSVLRALAGDREVALPIVGIVPRDTAGVDSSVVFVDVATAQEIFGKIGLLDRIDLIVEPARLAAVERAVGAAIPPGARAIRPKVRTDEISRMLQSFRLNLEALGWVALLVGMYLIYNTVAISVVQRRPEVGTVRALGATRGVVFRTFVGEGALIGVAGSLLGLALGALLATFSVAAVSRTVDTLYVGTHADRVAYDPALFVKAFVLGVLASIVSAAVPAFDAATTAPAITMRAQGFERRRPRFASRAAAAGLAVLVAAWVCTLVPAVGGVPVFGYVAGLLIIAGGSAFAPLAVRAVAHWGAAAAGRRPALGLAAANLGGAPLRTSVAVAALMIAIAMMVSVGVLVASFRTTVVAWADETLLADLFIRPLGLSDASSDTRFSPSVASRVARVSGVARVDAFRSVEIPYRGRLTNLFATDLSALGTRRRLRSVDGSDQLALARTMPGTTNVLVSQPFAMKFGVRRGDMVRLPTPSGEIAFNVAGVYNDYSSDAGVVLMDLATYRRLFRDESINSLAVFAAPGADLAVLRTAIVRAVLPLRIDVSTNRELRELVVRIFDRTFAITYALDVIAVVIAVMGVVSTLFALVLERRREFGVLRYLGVTAAGVRAIVLTEAGAIGVLGGGLGVFVGMLLALLLVFVINVQAFGWLIELHIPWAFLGETVLLVVVAAVLAGVYPARVAARIRTAEAVRTE